MRSGVGERAGAAVRSAALAVRADGDGREPVRDPARPARHGPAEGARLQLVLPRHGRRDVRDARHDGHVVARDGNLGPPVPLDETTRVVEWNDVDALERELAHGDVACVLAEPALTNIGIVPAASPASTTRCARLTRRHGTLLIIDETHTLCTGPGGYTAAHGLEPDVLTVGKAIGGGIPAAAYGFTDGGRRRASTPRSARDDVGRRRHRRHARRERPLARRDARDPHRGAHRRRPSPG